MPEEIIGKLRKNILPQWKTCFVSAIIVGLIAHFYKITNWLPNWDSLVFRYDAQNMVDIGRWFLPIASAPSSFYDLPWITGLLAIVLHGLGAVCICKMFDIQKNTTAALVGATVASFPVVTSVLMYNYVADAYALAFLLSCIAAMCLTAEKPRYIAPMILIALSAGIYQAYITVTVMLLLCYMIMQILYKSTDIKTTALGGVRFLFVGIIGMGLYYLILTVVLKVTGTELLEYQGVSSALSLSNIDIPGSLYTIKNSFTDYFFDFSSGVSVFTVVNLVIFAVTVLLYLADAMKNKLGAAKIAVLCVLVILLPIGASILAFVNSHVDYHNLMKMGFFVFYLFFLLQYERTQFTKSKINKIKLWSVLTVASVLIFNQIIIANVSYHKLGMAYEKSYGVLVRIADRIEQTDGAAECSRVMVVGALPDSEAYSAILPPDMTGTTDGLIIRADDEIVGQSVLCSALNDYCGKSYTFVYGEEKKDLLERVDAENIGCWPEKDSVSVIDDVIIIKLGDNYN